MMDFLLKHHYVEIVNGDLAICLTDKEALAQAIVMRRKTLAGECFLDEALAFPILPRYLAKNATNVLCESLSYPPSKPSPALRKSQILRLIRNDRTMTVIFTASLSYDNS